MKLSFLRPSKLLALALALGLAACGGKAMFDVGGNIDPDRPLHFDGLVLTNSKNGTTVTVPAKATSYKFATPIAYGTEYSVAITTQPLHQTCTAYNGADTAGRMAVINITLTCVLNEFSIGGTVSGLTSEGLVLINGDKSVEIPKEATSYAFPAKLPWGETYGVTIKTQPSNPKTICSVANPVGQIGLKGDADITNINVSCVTSL